MRETTACIHMWRGWPDAEGKISDRCRDCGAQDPLSTALDLLEAVDTAERERHAALVAAIEALPDGARGIMLAVLETLPALPVERIRALLHESGRGLVLAGGDRG